MRTHYHTIASSSTGFLKEKGSKFYAYAYPVMDTQQVNNCLLTLRKEHHQARHHCFAYVLNPEGTEFRASDDGEPKHSAGDPILGQIRSFDVTYVLVVVVRYFGGTKLGMGGLISAYRAAAQAALAAAKIQRKELFQTWTLDFDYALLNLVMRQVKELGLTIVSEQHTGKAHFKLEVPLTQLDGFKTKLAQHHLISAAEFKT